MANIPRNVSCPCGSGKKYKKCCRLDPQRDAELRRALAMSSDPATIRRLVNQPAQVLRLKVQLTDMGCTTIPEEVSRVVEILYTSTLHDLHGVIQQAFRWDNDHLYSFHLSDDFHDRRQEYAGTPRGEALSPPPWGRAPVAQAAAATELRDLGLETGRSFWYRFDYGDELLHRLTVLAVREAQPEEGKVARILEVVGEAPPQYGDEDW
ncbi:MAG: SEC-C metal-binding domain-containing protein [Thermodesulfobacteriota bacterium]